MKAHKNSKEYSWQIDTLFIHHYTTCNVCWSGSAAVWLPALVRSNFENCQLSYVYGFVSTYINSTNVGQIQFKRLNENKVVVLCAKPVVIVAWSTQNACHIPFGLQRAKCLGR